MYNNIRRCLILSIKNCKKFSMYEGVLAPKVDCRTNTRRWNNAIYTRVYCQAASNEKNKNQMDVITELQEKLDTYLSDPENKKRFQMLELEIDVLRYNAEKVPEKLTPKHWLTIINLKTKKQRIKYLQYLWLNEKATERIKAEKKLKNDEWEKFKATKLESEQTEDTGEMKYGLRYNTLFLRIYEPTMNHFYNGKLIQAMMFEPKIVFDCGYENQMTLREMHNCAKQMSMAFGNNRLHVNPMCLYFCNFDRDGMLMQYFRTIMPNVLNDDFPTIITSQSYLDLFPKDQLLYLTPHCRNDITEYDPDTIYIIGAMVDKVNPQPLSLAKAKREGIRMGKLPINKYLDWGSSSGKNLTLDQMMNIMLDLRHTKDWKEAFKHVPTRKLRPAREYQLMQKIQRSSYQEQRIQGYDEIQNPNSRIQTDFTFASRKSN